MLGSDLQRILAKRHHDVLIYELPEWDITKTNLIEAALEEVDTVVNCAAFTDVDGAESQAELARAVNALAVGDLGCLAAKRDRYVIHIGTDFVFDGAKKGFYSERDAPNPINTYGATKYEGEKFLVQSQCRCCILRIQWTYGLAGTNFITKIHKKANELTQLNVVDDQMGSPTHTVDVADAICDLIEPQTEGLFHYASRGYTTRYEVACFIVRELGLKVPVIPSKTIDYPTPATRPLNSRFDCTKIDKVVGPIRRNWADALRLFFLSCKHEN